MTRDERLKLDVLSLKAYGTSSRWQKIYNRGFLLQSGFKVADGKGGWRSGNQKTLVPIRSAHRFSIGTIRRIMLNRLKMFEAYRAAQNKAT